MLKALGIIETNGLPSALVIADTLTKSADVEFVKLENVDVGRISVVVKGDVGGIHQALATTKAHFFNHPSVRILGHHIVQCAGDAIETQLLHSRSSQSSYGSVEWLDD